MNNTEKKLCPRITLRKGRSTKLMYPGFTVYMAQDGRSHTVKMHDTVRRQALEQIEKNME